MGSQKLKFFRPERTKESKNYTVKRFLYFGIYAVKQLQFRSGSITFYLFEMGVHVSKKALLQQCFYVFNVLQYRDALGVTRKLTYQNLS